jgi:hypothetical protein
MEKYQPTPIHSIRFDKLSARGTKIRKRSFVQAGFHAWTSRRHRGPPGEQVRVGCLFQGSRIRWAHKATLVQSEVEGRNNYGTSKGCPSWSTFTQRSTTWSSKADSSWWIMMLVVHFLVSFRRQTNPVNGSFFRALGTFCGAYSNGRRYK